MWHCKETGGYATGTDEFIDNCKMIYSILSVKGWTLNAVCGVLGNFVAESGMNPWRWQGDRVLSSDSTYIDTSSGHAYGLAQWDPAGKYIHSDYSEGLASYGPNFSDSAGRLSDGAAQLDYLDSQPGYYPNKKYDFQISYSDYKASSETPGYLAKAWLHNYERPADQGTSAETTRAEYARYCYELLSGETPTPPEPDPTPPEPDPTPPEPTPTVTKRGLPVWMMIKYRYPIWRFPF